MRLLSVLLCLGSLVLPVHAQNSQPAALVVPVTDVPPFAFTDRQGERAGFLVTFARLIGEEIGVPIEFLEVANSRELVGAQASGRSNFIPGILKLPPLTATNVFSEEVAIDSLRPAVLETRSDLIQAGVLKGQRIAIVPPAAGSQEPVLSENRVIEYATPQAAMMGLFTGQVDAVLLPKQTQLFRVLYHASCQVWRSDFEKSSKTANAVQPSQIGCGTLPPYRRQRWPKLTLHAATRSFCRWQGPAPSRDTRTPPQRRFNGRKMDCKCL